MTTPIPIKTDKTKFKVQIAQRIFKFEKLNYLNFKMECNLKNNLNHLPRHNDHSVVSLTRHDVARSTVHPRPSSTVSRPTTRRTWYSENTRDARRPSDLHVEQWPSYRCIESFDRNSKKILWKFYVENLEKKLEFLKVKFCVNFLHELISSLNGCQIRLSK